MTTPPDGPVRICTWGGNCHLCPQPIQPGERVVLLQDYILVHEACARHVDRPGHTSNAA
jgi:hypothetical protein